MSDVSFLTVGDKLDIYSAEQLLTAVREALDTSTGLKIDLEGSEGLHATALQVLVAAALACRESRRSFELTGLSAKCASILRMTRLDRILGLDTGAAGQTLG
jgi:anti-anti-sigma factor